MTRLWCQRGRNKPKGNEIYIYLVRGTYKSEGEDAVKELDKAHITLHRGRTYTTN